MFRVSVLKVIWGCLVTVVKLFLPDRLLIFLL